jgi:hypothetical protein
VLRRSVLLLAIFLLSFCATAQDKKKLQTGDFLFLDLDCGPLCDAIESVTQSYGGQHFSHIGMVYERHDSVFVIEAIGSAVKLTWLPVFLKYSSKPAYHGRLGSSFRQLIPAAISFSISKLGVPYDDVFLYANGKYYCSELIYDAFLSANGNAPFFSLFPMTYKIPGTKEFDPAWVVYFKKLNQEIPEGKPGCNPGGISLSDKLEILGIWP